MENINQEVQKLNEWNAQGRYAEVVAETNTDIGLVTDDNIEEEVAALYVIRGNALFGLGRLQEALEAYGKAIELDTFDVEARCNYGSTLYSLGKYVDALNACDAAILTDENFAPSYINAAHCLVALKHEEEAVYALQQAFMLAPEDVKLGKTVADMAADLEDFEVALDSYLKVAALPDAPEDIQKSIFNCFMKFKDHEDVTRQDWQKGIDSWRNAFANSPEVMRLSGELLRG
ncbi:MAG: tetratricopeptide repeat protein [Pseudomonadota bacterium]|nr:tetratricopeptide repeat protein [Pseudomonadota bacterium]